MSSKDNLELKELNPNEIQCEVNIEDNNKSDNKQNWFKKLKKVQSNNKLDFKIDFNLEGLGTTELAKLHRDANRPLKKIKEFDDNIKFCPCCSLPKKHKGYIEEFNFNDNTDEFFKCGTGIPLYFSFFRFCLFILAFASITISVPIIILNDHYSNQLMDVCYDLYKKESFNISNKYPHCINFIGVEGISKYFINGSGWALKYNGMNLKVYRNLYKAFESKENKTKNKTASNVNKTLVDYSLIYFICLLSLFIINLIYIIVLNNINKRNDMLITTPGDYTAMISNLYYALEIFLKKLNKINKIIKKDLNDSEFSQNINERSSKDQNNILYKYYFLKQRMIEDLGLSDFPQDKEINIFEGFNTFIKNRLCVSPNGEKFNISQINICYNIKELKENEDKIQEIKSKILKINYDPKQILKNNKLNLKDNERRFFSYLLSIYGINICQLEKCKSIKLQELEEKQLNLQQKLNNLLIQSKNLTPENFTGVIFVTFNTKKDKEIFLKPFPKNFIMFLLKSFINLRYYFCGCFIHEDKRKRFFLKKNMSAEAAPEPEEIQFENLQITSYQRLARTILIYFFSALIIIVSFFIISSLNIEQKNIKDDESSHNLLVKYGISLSITVIISIINVALEIVLEILTKLERHITMTNFYLSYSIKLTLFTFINSSIIPLVSNYVYNNGDYDLLVTNMLIMFLTNSFVTPIMWTLNFKFFLKKLIQLIIERKKIHHCTQRELNNLYELPNMKISNKYSYLSKTLLMTFLYIPIFPLGLCISLFGFILGYFLEKYNFIKMYKRPEMLNSNLCSFYSNYFCINFFMLGIGNYIFIRDSNESNIWPLVNINVFAILIIIPYNQILLFDFIGIKEWQLKNNKNYEEEYFNFYNDYERANPMTKKDGMKRFIFKLKQKGYINTINTVILNTIDNINLMEVYYKTKKNFNNSITQRNLGQKQEKNEYENILKKFARGESFKNLFFKKNIIKENEKVDIEDEKEEIQNKEEDSENKEENVETSKSEAEEKNIKSICTKICLTSYIENNNINENSNRNLNENIININNINNNLHNPTVREYKYNESNLNKNDTEDKNSIEIKIMPTLEKKENKDNIDKYGNNIKEKENSNKDNPLYLMGFSDFLKNIYNTNPNNGNIEENQKDQENKE